MFLLVVVLFLSLSLCYCAGQRLVFIGLIFHVRLLNNCHVIFKGLVTKAIVLGVNAMIP